MNHLTEEQLVDLYYDRVARPHLQSCAACRDQFREIETLLNACADFPTPEPPPFRWKPPLTYRARQWRPWLVVPAFAAAMFAAFFIGRVTQKPPKLAAIQLADSGRERILLVTLGDHLERSQMVLLELANGDAAGFPRAQERARNLLGETRLYRQTATYAGDRNYSELLGELDRLLTAVANGQSQSSTPHAEQIEQLLFKIRVTDSILQKGTEKL